jgi:2-polyprenyl-3-methyl-5-hydroxy-6-metoxy-1,4-benzoquinol methylase
VGCGAGEVLKQLQQRLDKECDFLGCDISPQAIELCGSRANERLYFELGDVTKISERFFDVILVLDVTEHLEDYLHFCEPSRSEPSTKFSRSRWTSLCKWSYALPR